MIAAAALLIVAIGMSSYLGSHNKQMKLQSQKQEIIELKRLLLSQLGKSEVCTWQLRGHAIDLSKGGKSVPVSLTEIRSGPDSTSPLLAKAGELIPLSHYGVKVSTILFTDLVSTGNGNEYLGKFEISFDSLSTGMVLQPVTLLQIVKLREADPAHAKHVEVCVSTSEGAAVGTIDPKIPATAACGVGYVFPKLENMNEDDLKAVTPPHEHCHGMDPAVACPAGYQRLKQALPAVDGMTAFGVDIFTCVKN